MSIAKFQTPPVGSTTGSSKVGTYLLIASIIGIGIYLGYKYIYVPMKEKKSKADGEQND